MLSVFTRCARFVLGFRVSCLVSHDSCIVFASAGLSLFEGKTHAFLWTVLSRGGVYPGWPCSGPQPDSSGISTPSGELAGSSDTCFFLLSPSIPSHGVLWARVRVVENRKPYVAVTRTFLEALRGSRASRKWDSHDREVTLMKLQRYVDGAFLARFTLRNAPMRVYGGMGLVGVKWYWCQVKLAVSFWLHSSIC